MLAIALLAPACDAPENAGAETSAAALSSDPPVLLRFADAKQGGCRSCATWSGVVELEDIAYDKEVSVIWRMPTSYGSWGPWQETKAGYLTSIGNHRQLWSFEGVGGALASGGGPTQLAIRYRTQGREYWDNNGGANYEGVLGDGPFGAGTVGLSSPMGYGVDVAVVGASVSGSSLAAELLVRNTTLNKDVRAVYSTDYTAQGWNTVQTRAGDYLYGGQNGGERWRIQMPLDPSATKVAFAVSATQQGQTAWDNDFGRNFECRLGSGGTWTCTGASIVP